MPSTHTERLDVEDDDQRDARLRLLLQRTDNDNNSSTASPSSNHSSFVPPGPSSFDFGVRETHAIQPPIDLLARLDAFLPQMEAANAELARRIEADPESVDIEHLGDVPEEAEYVEMNLGLGVFEMRRPASGDSGATSTAGSSSSSSTSSTCPAGDGDSSEDDESSSDSDADASTPAIGSSPLNNTSAHRPIIPLPKNSSRPSIVVLSESVPHPSSHTTQVR